MSGRRTEKVLLRGVISKVVNMAVQFGYALVLTPVLLVKWGAEVFGVWLTVMSIYSLLMSLDIGHGTYVGTEFNKQFNLVKGGGKALLGSALKAQYVSGFVQFIVVLCLVKFDLIGFLVKTETLLDEVGVCLLILVVYRFVLGSARSVLVRIVYPIGYLDRMTYMYSLERLLELITVITVASMGYSIVTACTCVAIIRGAMTFLVGYAIGRMMPDYFPWWRDGDIMTGLRNYFKSLTLAASTMVDKLNTDGINLLISIFLGLQMVSVFATIRTLGNVVIQSVQLVAEPLLPEMTRYIVLREYHKLVGVVKSYWLSACSLCCLGLVISLTCIRPLYDLWVRNEILFENDLYAIIIMAVVVVAFGRALVVLVKSANDLRAIMILAFVRAVVVLGLGSLLIGKFGLIGIAIALLLSETVASGILPLYFVNRMFERGNFHVELVEILPALIPVVTALISITIWINGFLPVWLNVSVAVTIILGAVAYQWTMLSPEVKSKLRGVIS